MLRRDLRCRPQKQRRRKPQRVGWPWRSTCLAREKAAIDRPRDRPTDRKTDRPKDRHRHTQTYNEHGTATARTSIREQEFAKERSRVCKRAFVTARPRMCTCHVRAHIQESSLAEVHAGGRLSTCEHLFVMSEWVGESTCSSALSCVGASNRADVITGRGGGGVGEGRRRTGCQGAASRRKGVGRGFNPPPMRSRGAP